MLNNSLDESLGFDPFSCCSAIEGVKTTGMETATTNENRPPPTLPASASSTHDENNDANVAFFEDDDDDPPNNDESEEDVTDVGEGEEKNEMDEEIDDGLIRDDENGDDIAQQRQLETKATMECVDNDDDQRDVLERTVILDETLEAQTLLHNEDAKNDYGLQHCQPCDNNLEIEAEETSPYGEEWPIFYHEDSFNPNLMPLDAAINNVDDNIEDSVSFVQPSQQRILPMAQKQAPAPLAPFGAAAIRSDDVGCDFARILQASTSTAGNAKIGRRINLNEFSDPLLPPTKKTPTVIQDEFFGVYGLISRSELKQYKNRCYVGYTVDPNRRIRQHNAGKQFGGAGKTDSRGPWDMVCIIHGFPNAISALRFEWAWQNPQKSRRLRDVELVKSKRETPFEFRLRIACRMLNVDPWRRLALTFRWLLPECEIPFPVDCLPPPQIQTAYGKVLKTNTIVPTELNEYTLIKECALCGRKIQEIRHLLKCVSTMCGADFHAPCLAETTLSSSIPDNNSSLSPSSNNRPKASEVITATTSQPCAAISRHLVPLSVTCPKCACVHLWGDLVRLQRTFLQVDAAKPRYDDKQQPIITAASDTAASAAALAAASTVKMAEGMIPVQITKR